MALWSRGGRGVPRRLFLVCSRGGHLAEAEVVERLLLADFEEVYWLSSVDPRPSLDPAGSDKRFWLALPEVPSRRPLALLLGWPKVLAYLLRYRPRMLVSTGAAQALAVLPWSFAVGARAVFVESATRVETISLSGRILSLLPWIWKFKQYGPLPSAGWRRLPGVFDGFRSVERGPRPVRRLFVTLGTSAFAFDALVDRLRRIVPRDVEVAVQSGATDPARWPGRCRRALGRAEFQHHIRTADAVVGHAGVGTVLACLRAGKKPVLVPRTAARREHVDDHQVELARLLAAMDLAEVGEPDELHWGLIEKAAGCAIVREPAAEARGPGLSEVFPGLGRRLRRRVSG